MVVTFGKVLWLEWGEAELFIVVDFILSDVLLCNSIQNIYRRTGYDANLYY